MEFGRFVEICVPLLIMLVAFPRVCFAAGEPVPPPIVNIDLQGVIDAVNSGITGISQGIAAIPQAVLDSFTGFLRLETVSFVNPLFETMKTLMLYNIDPFSFQSYWVAIVSVVSAFYLLLFLVVGLRFLLGSYDAVHRKKAKEWFKGAIIIVVGVNASLVLYSLLLLVGSAIAQTLWVPGLEEMLSAASLDALNLVWLGLLSFIVFLAMVTLVLRQIFLIVAVMLVPIAIFLYFIPPTKAYGSAIVNLVFAFVFMQVLDVIILLGVSLFVNEFAMLPSIDLISLTAGFLFIFLANIGLMYFAIQKALHDFGVKVDAVGLAKTAVGAAVMLG